MLTSQDIQPDRGHIKQFADWLFGDARGLRQVWTLPSKKQGRFYGPGEHEKLAGEAVQLDASEHSIYLRMTTVNVDKVRRLDPGKRGGNEIAQEAVCLFADIDIAGPGHKHDKPVPLPPDVESAQKIVTTSSMPEPTAWVHSGGGLYPLWVLAEPTTDVATSDALMRRLDAELARSAAALGFDHGTGVRDLARVLRLPGTVNRKPERDEPALCRVLSVDGPRYRLEQLSAALPANVVNKETSAPAAVAPESLDPTNPLHDYRIRADWADILTPNGWTFYSQDNDGTRYWARPGITDHHAASTNRSGEVDRLFVWSTETPFAAQEPHNKDFVYAHYFHGGDHAAARAAIVAAGYGAQIPAATVLDVPVPPVPAVPGAAGFLRPLDEAVEAVKAGDLVAVARELCGADILTYEKYAKAIAETAVLGKDALKKLVAEQKAAIKAEAVELAAAQKRAEADDHAALAQQKGTLMPGPWDPMAAARHLAGQNDGVAAADRNHPDGTPLLRFWKGDWYAYDTERRYWRVEEDMAVRGWVYRRTENAVTRVQDDIKPWLPNVDRVNKVIDALASAVLYRGGDTTDDDPERIACRNYIVALDGSVEEHHPARFTTSCLPFDYDPSATCPRWLAFLEDVLPDDAQAHQLLAEFFGYVLSGDTSQQKMLSLIGPKRCGKGTISRVLEALLGPELCAAPTVGSIAGQFGRQSLIGKQLATFKDVRWTSRNAQDAVEPLLTIIGEDSQDVPRKNRVDWHGTLPTRFLAMSNDAPVFKDASGALSGRMLHIEFHRSFYGNEDTQLTAKLLEELPGVLNWALAGLRSLRTRGRFLEPESSREVRGEVELASSPFTAFAADKLFTGPGYADCFVSSSDLLTAYRLWHQAELGTAYAGTARALSDGLRSALRDRGVKPKRVSRPTPARGLVGVSLVEAPATVFPAGTLVVPSLN